MGAQVTYRERQRLWDGKIYRIRDVLADGCFLYCEALYRRHGRVLAHRCAEGSEFATLPVWGLRCRWPDQSWHKAA